MAVSQPNPDELALARKNRKTLVWLMVLVVVCASPAYLFREVLFPIFFKF